MIKSPPIPKYFQIAQDLMALIEAGTLAAGDQLPTEESLCAKYGVSRGTVRQAIQQLDGAGLIRRERGSGTFVTHPSNGRSLFTLEPFSQTLRRQNRMPSTKVLKAEIVAATAVIAQTLQLSEGDPIIHIERLQLADGEPVAHESRYLAQALCPQLLGHDLGHSSIHALLVDQYNIPLVKMTHTVEAGVLTAVQAQLLHADPDTPAFFVDRLTYTQRDNDKIPAVWFQAIYRDARLDLGATLRPSL